MSALDDLLKAHRKRIIDREEAAFREMLAVYRSLRQDLNKQYKAIEKEIMDAQAAGVEISPSWLSRSRRLKAMLAQVQAEIVRFGGRVTNIVSREQKEAINIAVDHAREVIELTSPGTPINLGSTLNARAVENAVGMMGDGSPMTAYFEKTFAPAVAEALRSEIVKAAALGTDFNTIARRLVKTGDITRSRALTMARTEVNRVRRATTLQLYRENDDVFEGWEWVAAKGPRTCPVCLALDGRIFKLKDEFPQHINCRCTLIPVIIGVMRPPRELGAEWFDRQPDDVKENILGVDGLAAYKEGLVQLKDFVGYATSKEFGRRVYTRPLIQVLAEKPVAEKVIRTPRKIEAVMGGGARARIEELLGRRLTDNQIGGLIGALDGATVEAATDGVDVYFRVRHPLIYRQERILSMDDWGRPFIHNNHFRKSRTAPSSIGLKSFATQAAHAEKYGVSYIDTHAAGDYKSSREKAGYNGYYSWPRMGYNARLSPNDWAKFPKTFRGIPDLNELFLQVNGKFVWKYHGSGRDMIFDLDRDARSWEILNRYLQEKLFDIRFD
jgi:SPP1 gp7 family putative phage head morphogenesis protein